jgi:hypothetical protein
MSNAIKCDRCGKFSTIYNRSDISDKRLSDIFVLRAKGKKDGWLRDLDLCPDCYKEFEKFMMRGKENEE